MAAEDLFVNPHTITNHESFDRNSNLLKEIHNTNNFNQNEQYIKANGKVTCITLQPQPIEIVIIALLGHCKALDCFNIHLKNNRF
jgi:hypothetical protein